MSSSCQFSLLMAVSRSVGDLQGFSGAKYSQTLSRLKTLAAVNCLKASTALKSCRFVQWMGTGGLSRAAQYSPPRFCAFGRHMGERKQPYKYLSKVYIYPGIFSALLYFSEKTITRLNQRYHYKHLCKVYISNGNFNLGRNVHEPGHNDLLLHKSAFLSTLCKQRFQTL